MTSTLTGEESLEEIGNGGTEPFEKSSVVASRLEESEGNKRFESKIGLRIRGLVLVRDYDGVESGFTR